jgi:hypothetical protein
MPSTKGLSLIRYYIRQQGIETRLCELTLDFPRRNLIRNLLRTPPVNLASDRKASAKDLLDRALQFLGHGLESHLASNLNDLVERDRLAVLDVLLLLPVSRGLLERLDDEGRGTRHDRDLSLAVLDRQLDRHPEAFLSIVSILHMN